MSCLSHRNEYIRIHQESVPIKGQLVGWLFLIFFYWVYKELIVGETFGSYVDFIILMVINVSLFYLNALCLFPRIIKNKKKWISKILLFLLFEVATLSILLILVSAILGGVRIDFSGNLLHFFITNFAAIIFIHSVGMFLSVGYYSFLLMLLERKAKEKKGAENYELENQLKVLEQDWLKAQLPIHFLRNTFTMLRYTIPNEPEVGEKCVYLLSEILRYYEEETTNGLILLSAEIDQVKRYLEMQELKAGKPQNVIVDIQGDVSNEKTLPMIALTLAENILKYGVLTDPSQPAEISIRIAAQQVYISTNNRIHSNRGGVLSTGIGLQNLRKRLDYFYGNNHSFLVENTGAHFKVEICFDAS